MTSIIRDVHVGARPDEVWDALRDFGAVDRRLVPGFVVECRLDGDATRVVTFFNGAVAREVLVGVDDDTRRLAYSVVESPLDIGHYNAGVQVLDQGERGCQLVWTVDVLPDTAAPVVGEMMDRGIEAIRRTLGSPSGVS